MVEPVELRDEAAQLRVVGVRCAELVDDFGKAPQQLALTAQHLAPEQVQRLNAVGTLVDRRNPAIAHQLLHAPLTNETVAAEHLHAVVGHFQPGVGHEGLADRREERQQVFGFLTRLGVAAQVRDIEHLRGEIGQRAVAFVEGFHGQQHAPHIGVDDDRVSRFFRGLGAGQRAHLQAVIGVLDRTLKTRLAQTQPLHAGAEPRVVHHGEHAVEAFVRLADQVTGGGIEVQHTGG